MSATENWYDCVPFPALLRAARNGYAAAVAAALAKAEFDDLPRNGAYMIGAIAREGVTLGQIIKELRVSKQAAGQLVDTLVLRGYLDRAVDGDDRRRLSLALTERGRAANEVVRGAIERIDAALLERIGPIYVAHARETLAALARLEEPPEGEE